MTSVAIETFLQLRGIDLTDKKAFSEWDMPSEISVEDGMVHWSEARAGPSWFGPPDDFFVRFLDLAGKGDDALERSVATYVRRWGPLGLCAEHGLPASHARVPWSAFMPAQEESWTASSCRPMEVNGGYGEPVWRWRELADQAVGTLLTRAAITDGEAFTPELVRRAAAFLPSGLAVSPTQKQPPPEGVEPLSPDDLGDVQGQLGGINVRAGVKPETVVGIAVRQWLAMCNVRPTFRWADTGYVFGVEIDGLAGGLALRLASDLMATRPQVRCGYCGRWYTQKRRNTYFCGDMEFCNKERLAQNKRRQRAGLSRSNRSRSR